MEKVEIGNATLYLGDCSVILTQLGKFDLLLTDPPYGINAAKGMGGGGTDATGRWKRKPRKYEGSWDSEQPTKEVFEMLLLSSRTHIIWGGNHFSYLLPKSGKWLFWDKLNSMPSYSDGETAWTSLDGVTIKKIALCNNGMASNRDGMRVHPTQKPVQIMEWCLSFVPDAVTVLDPFMGSGTTGVACHNMGKTFVGIEREPKYFEIACKRIEQAQAQLSLFDRAEVRKVAEQQSLL